MNMRNEKGFSIVELLFAILLLTIGLVAVAGMQSTAINGNAWANKLSTATVLAQEALEEILARGPSGAIFSGNSTAAYDLDPNTIGNNISIRGAGTFSATRTITVDTPVAGVVKIDVTITDGIRTVTMTGYKRIV